MLKLCPICAGEFFVPEPLCPDCGCNLVPEILQEAARDNTGSGSRKQIELAELCRPRLYPLAMVIKQTLEKNGILAIVQGANAISVLPHLGFGGELRILVDRERLDFARELYKAYFEGDGETDFIFDS